MTVKTMKATRLSVPPRVAHTELHRAIVDLDGECDRFDILASSLDFVTPLELCGLRALLDHASRRARVVHFDHPVNPNAHNYLTRMDFFRDLPENVELSGPVPQLRRNPLRESLIELCRITTIEGVEALPERVWQIARPHFGSGPIAKACGTAIAAATENVLNHAESPIGALVAAQRYKRTGIELAVVDLGVGIPTTLRRNPDYAELTDLDALEAALRDKVSATGKEGRGAGLWELLTTASRAGNATLTIQSGHAHHTVSCSKGGTTTYQSRPACPVPGTWIALQLQP